MRSLIRLIVLVLLIGGAVYFWRLYHPAPASSGPAGYSKSGGPPASVGVAVAKLADIPVIDNGLGTVTPLATVTVHTQISGILQNIYFTEGQLVHKGDVLALIDPRPYQALLAQAQGNVVRDQAILAQAETDLKRYQQLNRQDSIARQQVEDQGYIVQQDRGTVASDIGAVQTQQVNLIFCHITAPSDGRVGLRQVDQGNYVTPTDTNGVVVLTQLAPVSVIFTLPEDDLPDIMDKLGAGKPALLVDVYDRTDVTKLGSGTLQAVDTEIDPTTGTVKLRALFANADNGLFPSQFVNAHLLVDTRRGVVSVPNEALQTGVNGSFVYVVDETNLVHVSNVKTGVTDSVVTEITDGLQAGQRVVIDGADRLHDDVKVLVAGPAAAAGAAPKKGHHWHHQAQ